MQRRTFLTTTLAAGGGLIIGFRVAEASALPANGQTLQSSQRLNSVFKPNAWLSIEATGAITVHIPKTEMGQGTATGLAMIVAEELDADWSRVAVRTIEPDGKRFMITGGSWSIPGSWKSCRRAGAAAREMLVRAASARWGVEASSCSTRSSTVRHEPSGRSLRYGELVEAASTLEPVAEPPLKNPKTFTLIGQSVPPKNAERIVDATAQYGMDVRLPGMLYATIERSPVVNGRIARVDDRQAKAINGVKHIVRLRGNTFPTYNYLRDGVAVVATSTWKALEARKKLVVEWHESWTDAKAKNGAAASTTLLAQDFAAALKPESASNGVIARQIGTPETLKQAFANAAKTLEMHYDLPLQAHAPMEPMNATAHCTQERCEIWVPCHFQSRLLSAVRELTGLPTERIIIHTTALGGSFGRRLDVDYALEAVMLSREIQAPVQVIWTREDDIKYGLYAPPSSHHIRVALDAQGSLSAFDHRFAALSVWKQQEPEMLEANGLDYAASVDAIKFPYTSANVLIRQHVVEQPIRVFWWRRGYTPNHVFVNECVVDECAHAAGIDPLAYRLRLLEEAATLEFPDKTETISLSTQRLRGVLKAAAEQAGWNTPKPAQLQHAQQFGRGISCTMTDTYVGQVVEVSVNAGVIKVERVVTAVDCGIVINPQLVRAQVEGSIVFALTAALKGSITVEQGRVQQSNFHDYPMLRIQEMPRIETVLIPSTEDPTGTGEQISHLVAAALSNAIFAATGKRLRSLPMTLRA